MRLSLFFTSLLFAVEASRYNRSIKDDKEKNEMLSTNRFEYFEEKVTQLAGLSCDLCLHAVYGVNYDFKKLKKNVVEMIRLDCEALFHDRAEDIFECIRFMTAKVEKYSNKVEKLLDSRHVCVMLRVCAADDNTSPTTPRVPVQKDNQL